MAATIQKQLILKESRGQVVESPVTAANIAIYSESDIRDMLEGTNPLPEGIRFHFEKAANNATVGLIAIGLGVRSVTTPEQGTVLHNFEMSAPTRLYIQRGTTNNEMTAEEYNSNFAAQIEKATERNGITNACVFFSRTDLQNILRQDGVTQIGFFPATITRTFTTDPETFHTLVAIGLNDTGTMVGDQIRSEHPCPPHCGDDYPPQSPAAVPLNNDN